MNKEELESEVTKTEALICDLYELNKVHAAVGYICCLNVMMKVLMKNLVPPEEFNGLMDGAKKFYADHYEDMSKESGLSITEMVY